MTGPSSHPLPGSPASSQPTQRGSGCPVFSASEMHRVSDTGPARGHEALSQQRPPALPALRTRSPSLMHTCSPAAESALRLDTRGHAFPAAALTGLQTWRLETTLTLHSGRGVGRAVPSWGQRETPVLACPLQSPRCRLIFLKPHLSTGPFASLVPTCRPRAPRGWERPVLVSGSAANSICDPDPLTCAATCPRPGTGSGTSSEAPDPSCSTHHL